MNLERELKRIRCFVWRGEERLRCAVFWCVWIYGEVWVVIGIGVKFLEMLMEFLRENCLFCAMEFWKWISEFKFWMNVGKFWGEKMICMEREVRLRWVEFLEMLMEFWGKKDCCFEQEEKILRCIEVYEVNFRFTLNFERYLCRKKIRCFAREEKRLRCTLSINFEGLKGSMSYMRRESVNMIYLYIIGSTRCAWWMD